MISPVPVRVMAKAPPLRIASSKEVRKMGSCQRSRAGCMAQMSGSDATAWSARQSPACNGRSLMSPSVSMG